MHENRKVRQKKKLLSEWKVLANNYSWLHEKCWRLYRGINYSLMIPAICLSGSSGMMSMFGVSNKDCENNTNWIAISLGVMSVSSAVLTALHSYLRISELQEAHIIHSNEFDKLSRSIQVETILQNTDDQTYINLGEFIKDCKERFDRLIDSAPPIPERMIKRLKKVLIENNMDDNENEDISIHIKRKSLVILPNQPGTISSGSIEESVGKDDSTNKEDSIGKEYSIEKDYDPSSCPECRISLESTPNPPDISEISRVPSMYATTNFKPQINTGIYMSHPDVIKKVYELEGLKKIKSIQF